MMALVMSGGDGMMMTVMMMIMTMIAMISTARCRTQEDLTSKKMLRCRLKIC